MGGTAGGWSAVLFFKMSRFKPLFQFLFSNSGRGGCFGCSIIIWFSCFFLGFKMRLVLFLFRVGEGA